MSVQITNAHPTVVSDETESDARGADSPPEKRYGVTGRTNPQLLDSMFGLFANEPAFDRVMRRIEADRKREREKAERADSL